MTGCKRCAYLGYDCSQSVEVCSVPAVASLSISGPLEAVTTSDAQPQPAVKTTGRARGATVEGVSSQEGNVASNVAPVVKQNQFVFSEETCTTTIDRSAPEYRRREAEAARIAREIESTTEQHITGKAIDAVGDLPVSNTSGSAVEEQVIKEFKAFAEKERQKLMDKKRAQASQDRTTKLQDLKRFSQNFSLKSPVPADLVTILAKDTDKQQAIVEKARREHEKSMDTVAKGKQKSMIDISDAEKPRAPTYHERMFQKPAKKSIVVTKNAAGEAVDFPKPIGTPTNGAGLPLSGGQTNHVGSFSPAVPRRKPSNPILPKAAGIHEQRVSQSTQPATRPVSTGYRLPPFQPANDYANSYSMPTYTSIPTSTSFGSANPYVSITAIAQRLYVTTEL